MPEVASLARAAALTVGMASLGYTVFAIARLRAFARRPAPPPRELPAITLFKPLHGDEPLLYENLRSFCDQAYPQFQIIFCAADASDPALTVARRLAAEFPERDIEIAAGDAHPSANPKIGNILGAAGRAKHDIYVIADSDMRADRQYLSDIAACFDDPQTGAATALFGAQATDGIAAHLAAMQITEHFAPSVLVSEAIEPLAHCLGGTMAVRRGVLERIGGFEALADHLADDYRLGNQVHRAGFRVALSARPIRTTASDASLKALWLHELRWARTIRAVKPLGYAGSLLIYSLPLCALAALVARDAAGVALLGAAVALRALLRDQAQRALNTPALPAWLMPLRDLFSVAIWAGGLSGSAVRWRGCEYAMEADGRMAPAHRASGEA